jgi:response regulator RpfG family c-di-GMP phosphodiesterase
MTRKILCVDDDANLLSSVQRSLRKQFSVDTALGGEEALAMLDRQGPYAAIMADMRMPGMDGAQLLARAREKAPDTVRIMLTGNADRDTAINAVNRGHVYQFLVKPCSPEVMSMALENALKQYEMVAAERELLEHTLNGSIKVLTEILSVVEPEFFGRGHQLREYMRAFIQTSTESTWQLELGALLAPIGYVTIPGSVTAKARAGQPLTDTEADVLACMPEFASKLLANIPRLEPVARIVLYQNKRFDGSGFPADACAGEAIPIGARILKVLNDMLDLEAKGKTRVQALEEMQQRSGWYDPRVLDAAFDRLDGYLPKSNSATGTVQVVKAHELRPGQVFSSNVYTVDGVLVVKAGTKVTPMLMERLRNFARLQGLRDPLEVEV